MSYTLRNPDISMREAKLADLPHIHALLTQVQLSTDDILADNTRYWLVENTHGQPVGVVGLEMGVDALLLRSAAVSLSLQKQGLGTFLIQYVLGIATTIGYQRVYLFSTGSGTYWHRLGFREVPIAQLVVALPDAPQVKRYEALGCLATEIAWRLDLESTHS